MLELPAAEIRLDRTGSPQSRVAPGRPRDDSGPGSCLVLFLSDRSVSHFDPTESP
jgi:hypothetical protein